MPKKERIIHLIHKDEGPLFQGGARMEVPDLPKAQDSDEGGSSSKSESNEPQSSKEKSSE